MNCALSGSPLDFYVSIYWDSMKKFFQSVNIVYLRFMLVSKKFYLKGLLNIINKCQPFFPSRYIVVNMQIFTQPVSRSTY